MSRDEVWDENLVHVRAEQCGRCLFSTARLVEPEVAAKIVRTTRDADGYFICHRVQTSQEHASICRRWWDRFGPDNWKLRLAVALGMVKEVRGE